MTVIAAIGEETVRVVVSFVQYFKNRYIHNEVCSCGDEHDQGFFNEFFVDDAMSSLESYKEDEGPDYEDVGQCSKQFHSMKPKGHSAGRCFLGQIKEKERRKVAQNIADKVHSI